MRAAQHWDKLSDEGEIEDEQEMEIELRPQSKAGSVDVPFGDQHIGSECDSPQRRGEDENFVAPPFEFAVGPNPSGGPCGMCSTICCPRSCTTRVGNLVVLKETKNGAGERQLDCVVGPFWPVMVCITYPLIIGLVVIC